MEDRNDFAEQIATEVALAKKGDSPIPADVVLQDYVMLDFVDDFVDPGESRVPASHPARKPTLMDEGIPVVPR